MTQIPMVPCHKCGVPVMNNSVHLAWHRQQDHDYNQIASVLNAIATGINKLGERLGRR